MQIIIIHLLKLIVFTVNEDGNICIVRLAALLSTNILCHQILSGISMFFLIITWLPFRAFVYYLYMMWKPRSFELLSVI